MHIYYFDKINLKRKILGLERRGVNRNGFFMVKLKKLQSPCEGWNLFFVRGEAMLQPGSILKTCLKGSYRKGWILSALLLVIYFLTLNK